MISSVQYSELFGINLLHDYFDDGLCTALTLAPTTQCARLLDQNACLFRAETSRGAVWYGTRNDQDPVLDVEDVVPFTFLISTTDPEFAIYTAPDWGDGHLPGGCLYFDNLSVQTQQLAGEEQLVMPAAGAVVLPVRRHRFRHDFRKPLAGAKFTLHRQQNGVEVWRSVAPAVQVTFADIDLHDLADGRYILKLDGVEELDFYLTDTPAEHFLGVIDIFTTSNAGGIKPAHIDARSFAVSFSARKSRWRYLLTNHGAERDLSNANITSEPVATKFNAPVLTTLRGRAAWVITSIDTIPLYRSPAKHHKFELNLPQNGAKQSDPMQLAYATPAATRFENEGGAADLWSNIYVYL